MSINGSPLNLILSLDPDNENTMPPVSIIKVVGEFNISDDKSLIALWLQVRDLDRKTSLAFWGLDDPDVDLFDKGVFFRVTKTSNKQRIQVTCRFSYQGIESTVRSNEIIIPAKKN